MVAIHLASSFLTSSGVGRVLMISVVMLVTLSWFVRITLMKSFDCEPGIIEVVGWVPDFIMFRRISCPLSPVLEVFSSV